MDYFKLKQENVFDEHTCFYLHKYPLKKTTAMACTDDLLGFITVVKTPFHSVSLALGRGELRSQHALSGCVPEMPTASPLYIAPLP